MERTALVEAVDFLINTGTLNQLVEVVVSEVKKQPDDWRSHTCGECRWLDIPKGLGPHDDYPCLSSACKAEERRGSARALPCFVAREVKS